MTATADGTPGPLRPGDTGDFPGLPDVETLPLPEQVAVFDAIHAELSARLARAES